MIQINRLYQLIGISIFLGGCATITPRENFTRSLNSQIGKHIDEIPYYEFGAKKTQIGTTVLPNGNMENKYRAKTAPKDCIYVFEIDSATRKVLRWRIEGDDEGCILQP